MARKKRTLAQKQAIWAAIAAKHGIRNARIAIEEGHKVGIGPALAVAMLEQESGGHNVWGHDPTIFVGGFDRLHNKYWTVHPRRKGYVNKAGYLEYKRQRGTTRMQGVGPMQLTWWSTQDAADAIGGCWVPRYNIRIGFKSLSANIKAFGLRKGIERYNGSGPRAVAYSLSVLAKRAKWANPRYAAMMRRVMA